VGVSIGGERVGWNGGLVAFGLPLAHQPPPRRPRLDPVQHCILHHSIPPSILHPNRTRRWGAQNSFSLAKPFPSPPGSLSPDIYPQITFAPTMVVMSYANNVIVSRLSVWGVLGVFVGVEAVGWACQLASHRWLERRSPALHQNPWQAFILAPIFGWFDVMFALGYRQRLHRHVRNIARTQIKEFRATQLGSKLKSG